MVDFVQLQRIVKDRLEKDRGIRTVTVSGTTLEDAVAQAAVLLNLPVRKLEYEITEQGNRGVFGQGKKEWAIKVYERLTVETAEIEGLGEYEGDSLATPIIVDQDGEVFLNLSLDGAFLKVVAPKGNGRRIREGEATRLVQMRHVSEFDQALVSTIVKQATSEYIRIGSFEHKHANDSMLTVEVTEDEMSAFIMITPPGEGGCDISYDTYLSFLRNSRVVFGIKEDFLMEFVDKPIYRERIVAAQGLPPADGRHAYIQYNFETDQSKIKLREGSNGRIDFKDINIIQNVVEKQPLAKKIPPEKGEMGRTVTGKYLSARDGKDIPLPLGNNVHVGEDGATIVSDMNGQVVLAGGKIHVEPNYIVQGDVGLKTGNIIFLGNVVVSGNVEDGFSVKAAGNIEVNGTVGKAELDAEGDVIVHQGITGKNTGVVRAGRSLWARFIENSIIEAGNMVVVSDGIINSQVDANKRIICQGKRAHIVGGKLRAAEEINAKVIGSSTSGTETICEVGIDPKSKIHLETLKTKKADMEKQLAEVQSNLQTLINIKKQRKSLPEDKELYMRELMDKRQVLMTDLLKNKEEITKSEDMLLKIQTNGRVSASAKVYPGVKITIRDAINDVHTEYHAVSFVLENGLVRVSKYEEPSDDVKQVPDGYSTN